MRKQGESSGESRSEDDEDEDATLGATNSGARQKKIDSFFARTDGKGTGMRLSYAGAGHPLVLLL
jgi:cell cycle checkpoint protein